MPDYHTVEGMDDIHLFNTFNFNQFDIHLYNNDNMYFLILKEQTNKSLFELNKINKNLQALKEINKFSSFFDLYKLLRAVNCKVEMSLAILKNLCYLFLPRRL